MSASTRQATKGVAMKRFCASAIVGALLTLEVFASSAMAAEVPPTIAAQSFQLFGETYHEKRKTSFLDDSRCANLEVTRSEENPRRQNREDA
jgi:hypothetical protein